MATQTLHIAFCICEGTTFSDFVPSAEILCTLNHPPNNSPIQVKCDYVAPSLKPVGSLAGTNAPTVNPTATYANEKGVQYDVLFVPAGPLPDPKTGADTVPPEQYEFIKAQAPGCKYILSVCGGSTILAIAGLLSGKKATTNKAYFKQFQATTPKDIEWVAKARWVIDGNIWTSSGVTAGTDMCLAFVEHLVGPEIARTIRGLVEVEERKQQDDPFAEFHGLV